MTLEEAQKVASIVATADNGCPDCIQALVRYLREDFPEFRWIQYEDDSEQRVRVEPAS